MSDDPTRATPVPEGAPPSYGSVGPADPREDPVTRPAMLPDRLPVPGASEATDPRLKPVIPAAPDAPTTPTPVKPEWPVVARTRTGGLYAGLILSAIVLVFLLVFILQNLNPVTVTFLGFSGSLPIGVALLLAAIAGLLLVAIPGGLRILQLRRAARRAASR